MGPVVAEVVNENPQKKVSRKKGAVFNTAHLLSAEDVYAFWWYTCVSAMTLILCRTFPLLWWYISLTFRQYGVRDVLVSVLMIYFCVFEYIKKQINNIKAVLRNFLGTRTHECFKSFCEGHQGCMMICKCYESLAIEDIFVFL